MQPTLVQPFHRPGWVYEEKVDGWRMLAYKERGRVRLVSRQGVDHTARFAELATAIRRLPAPSIVLDGEVAVYDEKLISRFHLLSDPDPLIVTTPPIFMAFDVLFTRGRDLRGQPLSERRKRLEGELDGADMVFPVRRLASDGMAAWREVQERGYEGLVAKDPASLYRPGATRSWLKVKVRHEGRFLVGGIAVTADGYRGLVVGEREGNRLAYRGTVEWGVRMGLVSDLLAKANRLLRKTSPFVERVPGREVVWLEPRIVAEVSYAEIVHGRLRAPVFRGLHITAVDAGQRGR
jgi:bifunctional non-homologous end joining protein LigD